MRMGGQFFSSNFTEIIGKYRRFRDRGGMRAISISRNISKSMGPMKNSSKQKTFLIEQGSQ